jgi:hypothetical protein
MKRAVIGLITVLSPRRSSPTPSSRPDWHGNGTTDWLLGLGGAGRGFTVSASHVTRWSTETANPSKELPANTAAMQASVPPTYVVIRSESVPTHHARSSGRHRLADPVNGLGNGDAAPASMGPLRSHVSRPDS